MNNVKIKSIVALLILSSCFKIEDPPNIDKSFKENIYSNYYGAYQYWPIRQNIKWVFNVYTDTLGALTFLYNDTLKYSRDTNIAKSGYLYFSVFDFKRKPFDFQFIIGKYFTNSLYFYMEGVTYEAFNLDKIKYNVDSTFSYDGAPYNNDYLVSYESPLIKGFNTGLGSFDVIKAYVKYDKRNANGIRRTFKQEFTLAKDKGIMEFKNIFKSYNKFGFQDSSVSLVYKIHKIIY